MPSSEKQIQANRRNAQQSTGPRTPEGKQTSSRNALTHGILAREAVITHPHYQGSEDDFETLLTELQDDWEPEGSREELLVQQITVCYWRLRRILHADSLEFGKTLAQLQQPPDTMDCLGKTVTLYAPSLPPTERLDLILRYEKSLNQQLYRAMNELEHLQEQRRESAASPPLPIHPLDDPSQTPSLLPSPAHGVGRSLVGRLWAGGEGSPSPTQRILRNEPISPSSSTPRDQQATSASGENQEPGHPPLLASQSDRRILPGSAPIIRRR